MASLGALFGPKPPELGRDWLWEPTSQARYANIAGTSYLIASQSLFSLSGLMVLFSCLSAKGLGGDREALTIPQFAASITNLKGHIERVAVT